MGIEIIFKIAAVGIICAIINTILEKSDKKEIATLVTLTGLIIVLTMVVGLLNNLFTSLKTMFSFY